MSYDTLTATVPYAFGKGQEILFSYPSGRSADDYRSEGAVLSVGTGNLRQGAESFFVTYGSSGIRVFYNGPYQSSGSVTLKAPLSVEADSFSPAPLQPHKLQIVATRGQTYGQSSNIGGASDSNFTLFESRIKVQSGPVAVSDLRILYGNYIAQTGANGEAETPNAITVEGGIELTSPAVFHRAYLNGSKTALIAPGSHQVISEPLGIDLPANTAFWLQSATKVSSGEVCPAGLVYATGNTGEARYRSTLSTSQIGTTGTWSATSRTGGVNLFNAIAVLGVPATPMVSVLILGDSIADGATDQGDTFGQSGFIARALFNGFGSASFPYLKATISGELAYNLSNAKGARRLALTQYATHVIVSVSNDLSGFSLSQAQDSHTALWTALKRRGVRVYSCLITPRTTSTDNWATIANQTYVASWEPGGKRDQLNAWMRAQVGQGLLDGVIDPNPYCEDQSNLGKWVVTGSANYATPDGIHPGTVMNGLMAAAVRSVASGFSA